MHRVLTAVAVAAAVGVAACGGGNGLSGKKVAPPSAPPKAAASPVYGVPLPADATPDTELSTPNFESFLVPLDKSRFGDVDAFYRQELDEKPFRELTWCGSVLDDKGVYGLRVWKRDGGDDVFTLSLRFDPATGTHINASQAKNAAQACPPPPLDE